MTAREALEHINGVYAIEALIRERAQARSSAPEDGLDDLEEDDAGTTTFMGGARLASDGQSVVRSASSGKKGQVTVVGPKAQAVADRPHLTKGTDHYWPEWDELELEETDPSKPPLKIQW